MHNTLTSLGKGINSLAAMSGREMEGNTAHGQQGYLICQDLSVEHRDSWVCTNTRIGAVSHLMRSSSKGS